MVNERRYRDKLKVVKVIESCVTFSQLRVAENMIRAYDISYNTCSDLLNYTHYKQMDKLIKEQNNET